MHPIGKATQIVMKIALIYLMTKYFNLTAWEQTHYLPETILPYLNKAEIHVYEALISQYIQQLSDTLGEELPIVLPTGWQYLYHFNSDPSPGTDCSLMLLPSWASDAGREISLICEIGQYIKSVLVFKPQ